MTLTVAERKYRLPHGTQKEIAAAEGVARSYVSQVVSAAVTPRTERGWKTYRRIARRAARAMGVSLAEAFPELDGQQVA